jgi:hypothetical protein
MLLPDMRHEGKCIDCCYEGASPFIRYLLISVPEKIRVFNVSFPRSINKVSGLLNLV